MNIYSILLELYTTTSDVENICEIYSKLGKILYHMT
jgi:hypothetical protein